MLICMARHRHLASRTGGDSGLVLLLWAQGVLGTLRRGGLQMISSRIIRLQFMRLVVQTSGAGRRSGDTNTRTPPQWTGRGQGEGRQTGASDLRAWQGARTGPIRRADVSRPPTACNRRNELGGATLSCAGDRTLLITSPLISNQCIYMRRERDGVMTTSREDVDGTRSEALCAQGRPALILCVRPTSHLCIMDGDASRGSRLFGVGEGGRSDMRMECIGGHLER